MRFHNDNLTRTQESLSSHVRYCLTAGALVLYSSEKEASPREDSDRSAKGRKKRQGSSKRDPESVARVLENLGNVRRLMASVLYLNDREVCSSCQINYNMK